MMPAGFGLKTVSCEKRPTPTKHLTSENYARQQSEELPLEDVSSLQLSAISTLPQTTE